MADRYDIDRERDFDRERNAGRDWDRDRERRFASREDRPRDWDRSRDWGQNPGGERYPERRTEWDWDRNRGSYGREGRYGEARYGEGRYEDYSRERRGADEEWARRSERSADYGEPGDWGRQGSWGTYGNRPDYNRENDWREGRGRFESDWGGSNTSRTNLYGTGGGGFGSGFASYGAGLGGYSGGHSSFGGGMGTYGERGRFAGRGPKGWQRSDDRIREDVNERLTDHPHIDASEIEVQVKNGEVTLAGTVDERHAKRLAEDIAESVSGVREVRNNIRVQQREQYAGAQNQGESARGAPSTTTRNR